VELRTKSPFGDSPHIVISRPCGIRGCRASSPCEMHEQVVIRMNVDGVEYREAALMSKPAYRELQQVHRDPLEFAHMLADFVMLANQQMQLPPLSRAAEFLTQ
jgi:hypothetical protein